MNGAALRLFTARAMGSPLRLTAHGGGAAAGRRAWRAVRGEMTAADAELSRFRAESALSHANRVAGTGEWVHASPRLRRMLAAMHRAQRLTQGRFDPRVLRALESIGEHADVPLPPERDEERPPHAGWLERHGRAGWLRLATPVDSGGLGKGLGLRWALAAALRAAPTVEGVLLEAGGDIVASGRGPDDGSWSIGLEDPLDRERLMAVLRLSDRAVATSSIAIRGWVHEGRPVHHLIDPRTGAPAQGGLLAVTVSLPDPAWAEVWTKALFLAGRHAIGDEARARDLAVWWVEDDGSLHMTPAARQLTAWVASEASAA